MSGWINRIWTWLKRPSRLAWSLIAGIAFVGGVLFWGGFHTAMNATDNIQFCVSCHSMSKVYEEYKQTVHFQNNAGVRAICTDCHVPKEWGPYVLAKIEATGYLYAEVMGFIDTHEKFEDKRLVLAQRVWRRMEANDSQECRNCHALDFMTIDTQEEEAKNQHAKAIKDGETCISCHKGIAHEMPDMAGYAREMALAFMTRTESLDESDLWTKHTAPLLAEASGEARKIATILPGVGVTKLDRQGDFVKVRIEGWQAGESVRGQYAMFGKRILNLSISKDALDSVSYGETRYYSDGDQDWKRSTLEGWLAAKELTADGVMLWSIADTVYTSQCGVCHSTSVPKSRDVLSWQAAVQQYQDKTSLTDEEERLVLRYLQTNASDIEETPN